MTGNEAVSTDAIIANGTELGEGATAGPFCVIGWDGEEQVKIGARSRISAFALIEPGVVIGEDCLVDAYCRVGSGSVIGDRTQILYGAAVFENARIGVSCLIGGSVADGTVIEDYVTFMGTIAHSYRDPRDLRAWDDQPAPVASPTIRKRAVIGQNAILIGGVTIGERSYVSAGETLKVDLGDDELFQRGKILPMKRLHGLVKARSDRPGS